MSDELGSGSAISVAEAEMAHDCVAAEVAPVVAEAVEAEVVVEAAVEGMEALEACAAVFDQKGTAVQQVQRMTAVGKVDQEDLALGKGQEAVAVLAEISLQPQPLPNSSSCLCQLR